MHVYLDNAATTPIDQEVVEAMTPYLNTFYGNPSSQHAVGRKARAAIEQARKTIANIIGAKATEIVFTAGGTEAINIFLQGIAKNVKHIISSEIEHPAVLNTIKALRDQQKVTVSWVSLDKQGNVMLQSLENEIKTNPGALVALMHGNNEIGNLLPLNIIADLCTRYDAPFFTDAVQTMGHLPINVSQTPLSGLAASAHKFHGPKGVGFLYLKTGTKISSLYKGGEQERSVRPGTENVAAIIGMAKALEMSTKSLERDTKIILRLKTVLQEKLLKAIPGIEFNGSSNSEERSLYTILSVSIPQKEQNEMLIFNLDLNDIYVSAGSACASGAATKSHVLEKISTDMSNATIRFSLSKYNTLDEINYVVQTLSDIISN